MFNNQKQFYVFKNKKYDIFRKYFLIVFTYFLMVILKNNYINMKNN